MSDGDRTVADPAARPVLQQWKREVGQHKGRKSERPNYFYPRPDTLITSTGKPQFFVGSGDDIFARVLPELEAVEHELILVTCFWAPSSSRDRVCETLRKLSAKGVHSGRKIKVFIGLSSASLLQKLFHTNSLAGHTYTPMDCHRQLGLPRAKELKGLDLTVKSIFIKPFSVMHPKFIIADRKRAWLPSCNVSWETWFEGCIELSGPSLQSVVQFWESFWTSSKTRSAPQAMYDELSSILSVLLPSPHHVNPRFRFLPWQKYADPPSSPLNAFVLSLLATAEKSIYMQTPNLTAMPVLNAILSALQRGVDIHIVTSERLMILEQLVTAGTTTSRCIKWLMRRYRKLLAATDMDLEAGQRLGSLQMDYYVPREGDDGQEPVQSHLKLTIADETTVVLGSGNMDRASWYTSQELGIAIFDSSLAKTVRSTVNQALVGRTKPVLARIAQGV